MTDLVERDSELAAIETFVRRGGVMLIEAGAGVGKTSLLEAACVIARREQRIMLRARGSDLERDFAFGIVRQLFECRCADATANERDALLAGPARTVATLFQPDDSSVLDPLRCHFEEVISIAAFQVYLSDGVESLQ